MQEEAEKEAERTRDLYNFVIPKQVGAQGNQIKNLFFREGRSNTSFANHNNLTSADKANASNFLNRAVSPGKTQHGSAPGRGIAGSNSVKKMHNHYADLDNEKLLQ